MSLIQSLLVRGKPRERSEAGFLTMDDVAQLLTFGNFPLFLNQSLRGDREEVDSTFGGLITSAYRNNAVVLACMLARMQLFSEARFQFQELRKGRPGQYFGTPALGTLEEPEPDMTTGEMLTRAIVDADLGGNWFGVGRSGGVRRIRPDWTIIVVGTPNRDGSPHDIDAVKLGYIYKPGGMHSNIDPESLLRQEVAHFAPIPDPDTRYRGMSWLSAGIQDVLADSAATLHKKQFFSNAATPNLVIKFPPLLDMVKAKEFIELFDQDHTGSFNSYRTLFLLGGADVTAIGHNFQEMDFTKLQGEAETRIAALSGMHPTVVALSEGLQGSSLNTGNFDASVRLTANKTLRPLWRRMAGALQTIVPPPGGSRLWYDDRDIPFLAEDIKVAAEVLDLNSRSIAMLTRDGYLPESVIDAIVSGDLTRLAHSGFLSVQMNPMIPADGSIEGEESVALLAAGEPIEIRCTGTRADGTPCNQLIVKATRPGPLGIEGKCHRCGALVAA